MADELVVRLSEMVACPGAVEVLDALVEGARSPAGLRTAVPLSRRKLERVLRTLAAEGAITRCGEPGSWDLRLARSTRYALTPRGHEFVTIMSDLDVWVTIYESYLDDRGGRGDAAG
jgi:DNA-binding HxlR family transcriptional regulator